MGYVIIVWKQKNQKQMTNIEALRAMKDRRGNETIILFHNGDYFEAYEEDAKIVSSHLNIETKIVDEVLTIQIPEKQQESATNSLLDAGYSVCTSEMRDEDGNFITSINIIEDE